MASITHRVGAPANLTPAQVDANFDALNAELAAKVGLSDGDKGDIVVSSGGAVWSIDPAVLSTFGRTLADDADAAAARTTLGLGSAATHQSTDFVAASAVGASSGVAPLDSGGKVPAANLPSYVDDVLEFANLAAFPATGETGKIYIALDTNVQYRWTGSTYMGLVASPGTTDAVPEGTTNLYFTAARVASGIHAATGKSTPVDADELGLTDSAASFGLKKLTWANVKAGIWSALGALIAGGTTKATPVDGDLLPLSDSAASSATKYLSWLNLKVTLKAYFDTLYAAIGTGGGAGTKTYATLTAMDSQPPATAFATFNVRNSIGVLEFDDTSTEGATWVRVMPEGASLGSGIILNIFSMAATATSGAFVWEVSVERMNTDLDADSFDTSLTGSSTTNATCGIVTKTTITLTTFDSVAAGELFRVKIRRLPADASDTMVGDLQLVAIEVRSAA